MTMKLAISFALVVAPGAAAAETVTYTYDARSRLVHVSHSGGPASGVAAHYTHDAADNRTRVVTTGASH